MIREYKSTDLEDVQEMHKAQALGYALPNLNDPLLVGKLVTEDDWGRVVNAVFARLTAEVFFVCNPTAGTPRERWERIVALDREGCKHAYYPLGLSNLHCWIAPPFAKRFGKRIEQLGWKPAPWSTSYVKEF